MSPNTGEKYDERYLQIDHRIPYEVAGDDTATEADITKFILLTGAEQRQKSWSCENCNNFLEKKDINICEKCYWAYPENHSHVAMEEIRNVMVSWKGNEIDDFNSIKKESNKSGEPMQDYIKKTVKKNIKN